MQTSDRTSIPFNGGKMNHIFNPGRGCYAEGFTSDEAEQTFLDPESLISLKVDGECACLFKRDGEWVFCRRQDNYEGDEETIPVPKGLQPAEFQKHSYSFLPVDPALVTGKGKRKTAAGPETYKCIEKAIELKVIPEADSPAAPDFITVEWVGRKHQLNLDQIPFDHALYFHGFTPVRVPVRTRAAMKEMAHISAIEGMVFQSNRTGERFKLRLDMFEGSKFKALYKSRDGVTTVQPTVVTPDGFWPH